MSRCSLIPTVLLGLILAIGITAPLAASENAGEGPSIRARPAENAALPSGSIPPDRVRQYQDLAVRWMQEYLRIDTTNPPGNELKAAEWFNAIFQAEGIEHRLYEYAPGRADIWARVPALHNATSGRAPVILLNHMDVVSSDSAQWRAPPFSAEVVNGEMYGRGAQDMKSEGLAQLLVMVMLQREQPPRDRDVVFLGTADEEVHDSGVDWFIANHRELLGNAEFLITEGGLNLRHGSQVESVGVDIAEKAPFWLHVVAHGEAGHGSRPIEGSAPNRLVRALNRILAYQPELKSTPETEKLLAAIARCPSAPKEHEARSLIRQTAFERGTANDALLNELLRDTISVTMLGGAPQTNVIPAEAWANLDVRLVPGENPNDFLQNMNRVVDDANISIEPLDGFAKGNSSPVDTALFAAIQRVSEFYFPNSPVQPRLNSGYNESQRFRSLGMVCYGFSPYTTTAQEALTEHGDNERIRVEELRQGFRVLYDVLLEMK